MALFEELKPLVLGPWVRALAIYIEIIVFSLTLFAGSGFLDIISFSVLGIVWITDIVLCVRTRKAQKVSRYLETNVKPQPVLGVIVWDMIAGLLFLISFASYMATMQLGYGGFYYTGRALGSFVWIGDLAIGHIHIIMGGITAHALRQKKNGQKAAQRAHSREQSKHGAGAVVELAEPVEGPSRA